MSIDISSVAPGFSLTDNSGQEWGPVGGSATVVVFTSEHCPHARAWHDRLLAVGSDYAAQGAPVVEAVTQPVGCSIRWAD
jgi:hypothetical protein